MPTLRHRYQTLEFGERDIHLRTLRDNQQYHDPDGVADALGISSASWPLFGVVWASGEALARLMLDYDVAGRRILEVGCGIGLASLLLNERRSDITSTDQHPCAGQYLQRNVALNNGRAIPFVRSAWCEPAIELGEFDLIIGSDLLYERDQTGLLAQFIDQHARRQCEVVIIDPGRGNSARFSKQMAARGYSHSSRKVHDMASLTAPFNGNLLRYLRAA